MKRLQEHSFLIQHSDNSHEELFPGVQRVTASNQEMVISTFQQQENSLVIGIILLRLKNMQAETAMYA